MRKEEDLKIFQDSINFFYSSRLILIEKPISHLLSVLVSRPDYFSVIGECAKTASFKVEYKKAVLHTNSSEKKFFLPKSDTQIVSLVVGLFFEFDKAIISPTDFINTFFESPKPHDSYVKFCDNILKPFEQSFKNLYIGVTASPPSDSASRDLQNTSIPDKTKEECAYWIRKMIDSVLGDNSIPETLRKDCMKLLKGFLYVLEGNDPIILEIVWIGLYHTLKQVNNCFREIKELQVLLESYGAIE